MEDILWGIIGRLKVNYEQCKEWIILPLAIQKSIQKSSHGRLKNNQEEWNKLSPKKRQMIQLQKELDAKMVKKYHRELAIVLKKLCNDMLDKIDECFDNDNPFIRYENIPDGVKEGYWDGFHVEGLDLMWLCQDAIEQGPDCYDKWLKDTQKELDKETYWGGSTLNTSGMMIGSYQDLLLYVDALFPIHGYTNDTRRDGSKSRMPINIWDDIYDDISTKCYDIVYRTELKESSILGQREEKEKKDNKL